MRSLQTCSEPGSSLVMYDTCMPEHASSGMPFALVPGYDARWQAYLDPEIWSFKLFWIVGVVWIGSWYYCGTLCPTTLNLHPTYSEGTVKVFYLPYLTLE